MNNLNKQEQLTIKVNAEVSKTILEHKRYTKSMNKPLVDAYKKLMSRLYNVEIKEVAEI